MEFMKPIVDADLFVTSAEEENAKTAIDIGLTMQTSTYSLDALNSQRLQFTKIQPGDNYCQYPY